MQLLKKLLNCLWNWNTYFEETFFFKRSSRATKKKFFQGVAQKTEVSIRSSRLRIDEETNSLTEELERVIVVKIQNKFYHNLKNEIWT